MLIIRLVKIGKKNSPSYRVVLTQKTAPPQSGKFLELLGHYSPIEKTVGLKADRIKYWISQGVKTSDTVHNLLIKEKIIEGSKIKKKIKIKKKEVAKKDELKEKEDSKEVTDEKTEDKESVSEESKEEPIKEEPSKEEPKQDAPKEENLDKSDKKE